MLEENHHSFLIIEHDPMLYEDATEMVEYVAQEPLPSEGLEVQGLDSDMF
jgi:hypothetical protein